MSGRTGRADAAFEALSAIQRRKLLVALLERSSRGDTPVAVDVCIEPGAAESRIPVNHVHLPKLTEHGFIKWDRANDEVYEGAAFEEIRPLLELIVEHEDELPGSVV